MLWQFLFHPVIDIVDEFGAPAIDLGNQQGIPDLCSAFVQLGQSVRGPEQNSILKAPPLEGTE